MKLPQGSEASEVLAEVKDEVVGEQNMESGNQGRRNAQGFQVPGVIGFPAVQVFPVSRQLVSIKCKKLQQRQMSAW